MTNSNIQNQFVPAYTFSKPNQPLVIANEEALIKGSNGNILMSGKVEIRLDLLPEPWINVHFNNKNKLGWSERGNLMIESSLRNQFELDLTTKGKQIKVFYHKYDPSDPNESTIDFFPCIEPIIGIGNDSTLMQYINFYLLNFKKIRGKNTHINLKDDKWIVKLKPVPESNDNFTKLEKEGGYGLTHIGFICKSNNTDFSHKEAIEILDVLEYLFSFAKGDWCTPVCPTGFNSSGKVWELWSSPKLSGFPGPETWFSEYYSEQIENLFPGFMRCWYTENLNDTLRKAIYWYISAINSKIDVGIVLTQTVLESISFGYVVNVLKEKKVDTFTKLYAAAKINLLFSSLKLASYIPDGIKENTPELKKIADELKWSDKAVEAFVLVRNSLVHPNEKYRGKFESTLYYDVFNLGLWYIELSLLKMCEYSGTYCNRLTAKCINDIEDVPWK